MRRRCYDYESLTEEQVQAFKSELSRLERDVRKVRNDLHAAIREHVPERTARRFFDRGFGFMKKLDHVRFLLGDVNTRIDSLGPIGTTKGVSGHQPHEGSDDGV